MLRAFASFGFCKAHAAAFALPTYHSAWLKAHHPAAFLAGVLTHDPGMYPKRLILDDARNLGIAVLGLDVNASDGHLPRRAGLALRRAAAGDPRRASAPRAGPVPGLPDGSAYGIRLSLADVKGITAAEVERIVAGPPVRLAVGLLAPRPGRPPGGRAARRGGRVRLALRHRALEPGAPPRPGDPARPAAAGGRPRPAQPGHRAGGARRRPARPCPRATALGPTASAATDDVRGRARRRQAHVPAAATAAADLDVQLTLDLGDAPGEVAASGLPEMTDAERVRAELEVLGLDASRHVVDFYTPMLDALGVTRSRDLLRRRSQSEVLVAGVKVATQTPPVRSGRRVVFLTLDDSTGPVDATFFEDVQGPYAATVFGSWLLLVRGVIRRTGPRGISIRATGAWELGRRARRVAAGRRPRPWPRCSRTSRHARDDGDEAAVAGRAEQPVDPPGRWSRPPRRGAQSGGLRRRARCGGVAAVRAPAAGGMGQRGSEPRARGAGAPGARARQRVPPVAVRRHQAPGRRRRRHPRPGRREEDRAKQHDRRPRAELWHSSPASSVASCAVRSECGRMWAHAARAETRPGR